MSSPDKPSPGALKGEDTAAPKSPTKPAALATPSNTPVAHPLFPKAGGGSGGVKRPYEEVDKVNAEVKGLADAMARVNVTAKPAAGKTADPKLEGEDDGKVDDEEDEEDAEDEDEEEEDEEELAEGEDDFEYVATPDERNAVLGDLDINQEEYWETQAAYLRERYALELKYQTLRAPIFERRREIINGPAGSDPKLRGFWLDVLKRNSIARDYIEPHDEQALCMLQDITMKDIDVEGRFGFELVFSFHPSNPFFTNPTLTKRFLYHGLYSGTNPNMESSEGTAINWLPEKKLTTVIEETKVKKANRRGRGGGGGVQIVRKEVPRASFFHFFESRKMISDDEETTMTNEEFQEWNEMFIMDESLAYVLRHKLIPQAVEWYKGEADDSDAPDDEDEEYEEDDEEDDDVDQDDVDEDEDDDDDDDADDDKPAGKPAKGKADKPAKGKAGGSDAAAPAGGAGAEEKPECKQQ